MITAPPPARQAPPPPVRWQQAWRDAVRDPRELLALLGLGTMAAAIPDGPPGPAGADAFPLRVPRGFVARMRRGDPRDPLLRQVLPLDAESRPMPGLECSGEKRRAPAVNHLPFIPCRSGRSSFLHPGRIPCLPRIARV